MVSDRMRVLCCSIISNGIGNTNYYYHKMKVKDNTLLNSGFLELSIVLLGLFI